MFIPIDWLDSALDDLSSILTYIASKSPAAAIKMKRVLESSVLRTASFPSIGRLGRVNGTREIIAHPNYVVVYRVDPARIAILNVLHTRRQYP